MARYSTSAVFFSIAFAFTFSVHSAALPEKDLRAAAPKTLNTLREFPQIKSRAEWEIRAEQIRQHVLVSCGLWPLPAKTPLNPHISGRIERDGYSVENVYFQTRPGFYLAGNLYRPVGKGQGPFPGVLNPHGHWKEGRFADTELGSIAARCINFARQGMVAFSYDMVGYNDTAQVKHTFAADPTNQLWNISLMGLQTWNGIRALDFLAALPDVNPKRLACTGESGGGTQTFMLGAIDNRLAAQAPIVMVSHSMQGGCLCENAPGLRVDYSNMEIAAVPAPRPQILVAATGDWTKKTMEVEGPAIESVYRLFRADDKIKYKIFNFDHNYNRTTREAVYDAFDHWLLDQSPADGVKEVAYIKETNSVLRVFPEGKLPEDALSEEQLIAALIKDTSAIRPDMVLWQHTLQVEFPEKRLVVEAAETRKIGNYSIQTLAIGRANRGDRVPVAMITPAKDRLRTVVVLAHPDGKAAYLDAEGAVKGLAKEFLQNEQSVILLDLFLTGDSEAAAARKHTANYFTTYNRTDAQERVQDLITACAFAQTHAKGRKVVLCGEGRAGLYAMLAAPAADALIADADALDYSSDSALMSQDLFIPGLRRMGGFAAALSLDPSKRTFVHNTGKHLTLQSQRDRAKVEPTRADPSELIRWAENFGKQNNLSRAN